MINGYESEFDDIIPISKPRVKLFRKTQKRGIRPLNIKSRVGSSDELYNTIAKLKSLSISRTSPHRFNRLFLLDK